MFDRRAGTILLLLLLSIFEHFGVVTRSLEIKLRYAAVRISPISPVGCRRLDITVLSRSSSYLVDNGLVYKNTNGRSSDTRYLIIFFALAVYPFLFYRLGAMFASKIHIQNENKVNFKKKTYAELQELYERQRKILSNKCVHFVLKYCCWPLKC